MKKNILNVTALIGALVMAIGFIVSCSKYNEGPAISLTSNDKKLIQTWSAIKIVTPVAGVEPNPLTANLTNVEFIFEEGGEFELNATTQTTVFASSGSFATDIPYEITGTWEWAKDETEIALNIDGEQIVYIVIELSKNKLTLRDEQDFRLEFERVD